ncbi:hypothetical protein Tco_0415009 [Tanacetum coccineum]
METKGAYLDHSHKNKWDLPLKKFEAFRRGTKDMLSIVWLLWKYDMRQGQTLRDLESIMIQLNLKSIHSFWRSKCLVAKAFEMKYFVAQKIGARELSEYQQLVKSQSATFKGRIACKVWTLKEDLDEIPKGRTVRNAVFTELLTFSLELMMKLCSFGVSDQDVILVFWKLTPLTPPMLEVATAVRAEHSLHTEELDITPSSHHSDDSSYGEKQKVMYSALKDQPSPNDYLQQMSCSIFLGLSKDKDPCEESYNMIAEMIFVRLAYFVKKEKGTAEVNEGTAEVHEGTAEVNEGTAEVNESTAGANLSTEPSMKEVEDEAGPSTFQDESDEFIQDDTLIADILVNITRPRRGAGITIPGNIPEQERPESPTLILDPKDKGKGIMKEEPKKKKLTLQQLRAAETANDEEVARKDNEMIAAEVQRIERENFTEEQKAKFLVETIAAQRRFRAEQQAALRRSKPPTIPQLRNQMMKVQCQFVAVASIRKDDKAIKGDDEKVEELQRREKVVDFEGDSAQDVEVMEQHSLISRFSIIQSPEGEYIAVQRANGHIRAFNTLNEVLHILDRQDLHHLHRLVIEYYEHIPPTGLGLILYGDLTTMMETTEESDDELWRNQTEWEIIRWRLYESTGVHILELENGTMIHMLVEQRYPLTRELMQRMLEHKLEVQKETEDALNVIRFVMKQKEDLEREEE